jgi:hypothetical protein
MFNLICFLCKRLAIQQSCLEVNNSGASSDRVHSIHNSFMCRDGFATSDTVASSAFRAPTHAGYVMCRHWWITSVSLSLPFDSRCGDRMLITRRKKKPKTRQMLSLTVSQTFSGACEHSHVDTHAATSCTCAPPAPPVPTPTI